MAVRLDANTLLSGENGSFPAKLLPAGGVTADNLADGAITTAKLAADAVTGAKIADLAVDTEHLAAGAVTVAKIDSASATSGHVLTANGTGGATFSAPAGGGPAYYHAGGAASTPQTVTMSQAEITGATVTLPSVAVGDRLDIHAVLEIVANGGTENVELRVQIGGTDALSLGIQAATALYHTYGTFIVDTVAASGAVTGYDVENNSNVSLTIATDGAVVIRGVVASSGTAATVRVRSLTVVHYSE